MKSKQHFDPHDGKQTSSELDFIYCPKCSAKLVKKVFDGTVRAGDDLAELEWIDKSTTLPVMAFEADKIIIKRYFENALIRIPMDRL